MPFLGNQEDKVEAVRGGLVQALAARYGTAIAGDSKETASVREWALKTMERCVRLIQGRDVVLKQVGLDRVLGYLKDPEPAVRNAACELLREMVQHSDAQAPMIGPSKKALIDVLNGDKDDTVAIASLGPLAKLTEFNQEIDAKTMSRVVALLRDLTPRAVEKPADQGARIDMPAVRSLRDALQMLMNTASKGAEKKVAIDAGAVPAAAAVFGSDAYGTETRRLASALAMAVTIDEAGKSAAIECKGCVSALCRLASEGKTGAGVAANATEALRNICENKKGLLQCTGVLLGAPRQARRILGPVKMVQLLDPVFSSGDNAQIKAMLGGFQVLLEDDEGVEAVWGCCEIVEKLIAAMDCDDSRTTELCNECLFALCSKSIDARAALRRATSCVEKASGTSKLSEQVRSFTVTLG